jgi:hypothetical protein
LLRSEAEPATTALVEQARFTFGEEMVISPLWHLCLPAYRPREQAMGIYRH